MTTKLNFYRHHNNMEMLYQLKMSLSTYKKKRKPLQANLLVVPPSEKQLFEAAARELNLSIIEDSALKPKYYVLDSVTA